MKIRAGNRQETPIRIILMLFVALVCCVGKNSAQDMSTHHHVTNSTNVNEEAIQDWAKQKLAKSPRHSEWVKVKNGTREVNSFVVYPESNKKATAVVVIHEIFGMSDWVQQLTDELAEAGYIAIAPDLLSGMGPNGGGTSSLEGNAVRQAIGALPPAQLAADLNAVADYIAKVPGAERQGRCRRVLLGRIPKLRFCDQPANPESSLCLLWQRAGKQRSGTAVRARQRSFGEDRCARLWFLCRKRYAD
jgi:hypothetical protein